MKTIIMPKKLEIGDEIRVISPSISMGYIDTGIINSAVSYIENKGMKVTFSKNSYKKGIGISSSIESRVNDIHDAFGDPNVKMIIASLGGYSSVQLLEYIDFDLIRKNPKQFCGYSDITILTNAIFSKTGLITYNGPLFASFGLKNNIEYTWDYFNKCLFQETPYSLESSDFWYDYGDDKKSNDNEGYLVLNNGVGEGVLVGGNIPAFNLLVGTDFFPGLNNKILFVELNELYGKWSTHRLEQYLRVLFMQKDNKLKGLLIGRFHSDCPINLKEFTEIIQSIEELKNIPVLYNVDFGHTSPFVTLPVGGVIRINDNKISIIKH